MTDLEAVNRALVLINQEQITSLAENSKSARAMNMLLDADKRLVLEAFPWTFAARRTTPTSGGAQPGFSRSFSVPLDALVVRALIGARGVLSVWRVIGNHLVCDETVDAIEYTAYVPDLSKWPVHVADALVQRLAADASVGVSGAPEFSQALMERYFALMRVAQSADVVNEKPPHPEATHYIDCRG